MIEFLEATSITGSIGLDACLGVIVGVITACGIHEYRMWRVFNP